jgi:hypothetical protein
MSSSSLISSFFLTSSSTLFKAYSSILTYIITLFMRTYSPLTLLLLYYSSTSDFSLLN